jgi:molybdopterin-containing oxidoreductase family membrane subunit
VATEKLELPAELIPDPGPNRILSPGHTYESVSDRIGGVVLLPLTKAPKKWLVGAFISFIFVNLLMLCMYVLFTKGIGIWGVNIPIGWGFAIVNFVCGSVSATRGR